MTRGVRAKKVLVFISKEALRPFSLSPLNVLALVSVSSAEVERSYLDSYVISELSKTYPKVYLL